MTWCSKQDQKLDNWLDSRLDHIHRTRLADHSRRDDANRTCGTRVTSLEGLGVRDHTQRAAGAGDEVSKAFRDQEAESLKGREMEARVWPRQ